MLLDKLSTESSEPAGLEQNNYCCKFFRQKKMILGGRMEVKEAWRVMDYKQANIDCIKT